MTHSSPMWERVLLFLSIALMKSLGIEVHVCIEPELSTVDGIVIAPGSQAVIANWVRASSAWVTDVTKDKSLLASYQDKIDFSVRASVNAGDDPRQRLQSLSAYLAPVWDSVYLENAEAIGCGTIATDAAGEISLHVHISVGLKAHSATAHTSHLLRGGSASSPRCTWSR